MDKTSATNTVKLIKEQSTKRKFKQTFDLILNLKDLDLKKTENQVDLFATLRYSKGKIPKICGLVGAELSDQSKKVFEHTIIADDFSKFAKDKKAIKKLAEEYDFFVAQANIMTQVAANFGRVLGPRAKMPNPKAGCVVPPNANLMVLSERLHNVVRLVAKAQPVVQVPVGSEDMKDDEIADNITTVYNTLEHSLPQGHNNIKNIYLKLTMGKAFRIMESGEIYKKEEKTEEVLKKGKKKK